MSFFFQNLPLNVHITWSLDFELMRFIWHSSTNKATCLLICINYSFRLIRIFVQQNLKQHYCFLFFLKIRMVKIGLQYCILTCSFFSWLLLVLSYLHVRRLSLRCSNKLGENLSLSWFNGIMESYQTAYKVLKL